MMTAISSKERTLGARQDDASLDIERQRRFWNSWNSKYRARGRALPEANERQASAVIDWIAQIERADLSILEVGCGSGWLSERLTRFGQVTATDLSDELPLRWGAQPTGISFVAGDFFELEFPSAGFDVIVALEVLSHVCDQRAFIAKISRLLRQGGYLMLATQNRFVLQRWSQVQPQAAGQIRNWIGVRTLRRLLREQFEIEELRSIAPVGDRGILRLINAPRFTRVLERFTSHERIKAVKERLLLGHTLVVRARKPAGST